MTKQEATQLGQQHFANGKQCTPHDCIKFDQSVFALVRENGDIKLYAKLRGAFNSGWESELHSTYTNEN